MVLVNRLWSCLVRGRPRLYPASYMYSRSVTSSAYVRQSPADAMLDALVPYTDELFCYATAEQLIQLVLRSKYRELLYTLDPVNTYEKHDLLYPAAGVTISGCPMKTYPVLQDEPLRALGNGIGTQTYQLATDGSLTRNNLLLGTLVMQDKLSQEIALQPGLRVRFGGSLPGSSALFVVRYTLEVRTECAAALQRLNAMASLYWALPELQQTWQQDQNWVNRLAAAVLSAGMGASSV